MADRVPVSRVPIKGKAGGVATTRDFWIWSTRTLRGEEHVSPVSPGEWALLAQREKEACGLGQREEQLLAKLQEGTPQDPDYPSDLQRLRCLIYDIYKEHNPSKLDDVDRLLSKYKGHEQRLYQLILAKYQKSEPSVRARAGAMCAKSLGASSAASRSDGPRPTADGQAAAADEAHRSRAEERLRATADLQESCVALCAEFNLGEEILKLLRMLDRRSLEELLSGPKLREKLGDPHQHDKEERLLWMLTTFDAEVPLLAGYAGASWAGMADQLQLARQEHLQKRRRVQALTTC